MTNEERDLITQFMQRVAGTPVRAPGSVPSTLPATQALPPIDREADALIADLMQRHPEARYRLTQMAFVQEHALAEAQNTINRLQWELDQARAQQGHGQQGYAQPQGYPQAPASPWGAAAQPPPQPPSRGLFGGLFGGRQAAPPPPPAQHMPPPPQLVHAPGYQPGMFQQRGGSGFLGSALTTAAGVAGGMVVGNMLMNAFSGGGAAQAASAAASSPWTNPTSDPYAQGGEPKDGGWEQATPASHQDSGWEQADSGWSDAGSDEEV